DPQVVALARIAGVPVQAPLAIGRDGGAREIAVGRVDVEGVAGAGARLSPGEDETVTAAARRSRHDRDDRLTRGRRRRRVARDEPLVGPVAAGIDARPRDDVAVEITRVELLPSHN